MTDYKKLYQKELKKSRYAWGQYFQLRNELFNHHENIYNEVEEEIGTYEEGDVALSPHLMNFIKDLYEEAKKNVECPICIEKIDSNDLETTGCGHNYHKECLCRVKENSPNRFINCPICRKKIYK